MRLRPILPAIAISLAMILGINLAMIPWSQRLPWRLKLEAIRQTQHPDVMFVGDSLLDTRLDPAALNQGAARQGESFVPVNAALVSSLPPDQALLADYAADQHPGIPMMVIGVMDFLLTKDVHLRAQDMTGNHEVGVFSYFPVSLVSKVNQWGPLDRLELRFLRLSPMFANRSNGWEHIEILRRALGQVGMPPELRNRFGRVADMVALEASSGEEFDQQAQAFLNSPNFNSSYEEVFSLARQKHMKVVLIVMPMSAEHLDRFYSRESWHAYLEKLNELAAQRGFTVIDGSTWMPGSDCFMDHVHLSDKGVSIFSEELGERLARFKRE